MPTIRDARADDEPAWRRLWDRYISFYETFVPDEVTARTWARILDPAAPLFCRVAEVRGVAQGFALCVLHEGTWVATPVCYLEDLFVDPAHRGLGLGRALIQDLFDRGRARGWSTLYWHTRAGNPARRLYDGFVPADDAVRYRMRL